MPYPESTTRDCCFWGFCLIQPGEGVGGLVACVFFGLSITIEAAAVYVGKTDHLNTFRRYLLAYLYY